MERKILVLGYKDVLERLNNVFTKQDLRGNYDFTIVDVDEYFKGLKSDWPEEIRGKSYDAVLLDEANLITRPFTLPLLVDTMEFCGITCGYIRWGTYGVGADTTGKNKLYLGASKGKQIKADLDRWFEKYPPEVSLLEGSVL